jgi:hypothetical protein
VKSLVRNQISKLGELTIEIRSRERLRDSETDKEVALCNPSWLNHVLAKKGNDDLS